MKGFFFKATRQRLITFCAVKGEKWNCVYVISCNTTLHERIVNASQLDLCAWQSVNLLIAIPNFFKLIWTKANFQHISVFCWNKSALRATTLMTENSWTFKSFTCCVNFFYDRSQTVGKVRWSNKTISHHFYCPKNFLLFAFIGTIKARCNGQRPSSSAKVELISLVIMEKRSCTTSTKERWKQKTHKHETSSV